MSGKDQPTSVPSWLAPAIVVLLGVQLALLYMNGMQIHRQRWDINDLKHEVRYLADLIEQGVYEEDPGSQGETSIRRIRMRLQRNQSFQKVVLEEEPEPALRDIETTRQDAQRAVKDAREIQQKLSIEENIRKSEEKARIQAEQNKWHKYVGLGVALVLLAIFTRSYLRRRG